MRRNHLQGMADVVTLYLHENPSSRLFEGRTLTMGGSCRVEDGALVGDLSALTMVFTGGWLSTVRAPSRKAVHKHNVKLNSFMLHKIIFAFQSPYAEWFVCFGR